MAVNKTSSVVSVFQWDHTAYHGCEPFCILLPHIVVVTVFSMSFQKKPLF